MSDRPNAYPNFSNNFSQGLPSQQAQHRPSQQLSSLGAQSTLTGIRKPEDRVWQQMQQQRQQQQQQQQQLQQQQQHSSGESIHVTMPPQQQLFRYLQVQVAQGHMTREQAQERLTMLQASAHTFQEQNVPQQIPPGFAAGGMAGGSAQQQMAALSQRSQAPGSNPMIQRVMQAQAQAQQDSLHARQLNMLVAQGQQQPNGFARVGQNLHPPGMGLPQGQGSLQQNFIQPSPSVPPANIQSSVVPSTSQPTPLGGAQIHNLPKNLVDMSMQQLSNSYSQLMRIVEDGEKNLNAAGASTSSEGDMQRQAYRARLDQQKQLLVNIRELINLKRQGGDPAQQTVNGAWLGAGQRAAGLYSVPERPPQHNSPLNQASVNQIPPQGRIPTPQQSFVPSTAQSNLTQMSPHVSGNGLPFNGALTQIPSTPPQPPPQAPRLTLQRTIQCSKLPPLPEDRFKALFMQFANTTGLRLNDRDFIIDNRPVSAWALHRAVFARNGFDLVTANDEWPAVGAALGFPSFPAGDPTPLRCAPNIAHRLKQLYNDSLRHFEQAYLNNVITRLRTQAVASAQASQQQLQPHQPTDADYQALLASIPSDASTMPPEAMSILPRFSHTSGPELEAHRVPPHIVAFVEQQRENLQRAAQDQNGFRAGLTSTKNLPPDNRTQINPASAFQGMARPPPQPIPNHHTQLQMSRQPPAQPQGGKPNTLQPTQLTNNGGMLARPSTAQSMGASSMSSMGTQITGAGPNGGAQGQSGSMSAPLTQGGMNVTASSSILTQPAGTIPMRRPTPEELASAKRWVDEQRRIAFNHSFDGVAGSPVPESDISEYTRNLERLDMVLGNIERYIHIAFAALRKEDVVRRMFAMMASTKSQLEENKKPKPRYVLELHTIRGMIQEADNMDKGLRTVLGLKLATQGSAPVPQQPQQPPPTGPTPSFAPPAAPPVAIGGPRPPPTAPFSSGHRKRPSQAQVNGAAMSTPTPPPAPTGSTPTLQAATPGITAPSPQTPKSPKGKAAAKPPKVPTRRKGSTKANSLETASSAPAVASTPTSSTPVDTKSGVKRVREDEADGTTPGVASAPSPKRVKSDWEGPPNEEARKRDEQADNVKTDEQALAFFETVTKFIDENPESAEAASNALDEILRTYPPAPDIDDAAMGSSFHFGDLPPTSPHPLGNDVFGEFIDISAFDDTPTPDLVAGSSTNPSPESTSDQDHPHTGRAGSSPQIPNVKTEDTTYELLRPSVWKEISGGDATFHQTPAWTWEGHMDTPDQPWHISTS
ncbi:hypothetical protein EDB87DRAFT_1628606 [Lactarius vividus]|nr:hypothetical protein EDB87DRAFT_1628606 [Lactarius vividus]